MPLNSAILTPLALAAIFIATVVSCPKAQAQTVTSATPAQESSTASPSAEENRLLMEYDRLRNPYPILRLSINGHKSLPFMMDTGTNFPLTVLPWAARELDLKPNGKRSEDGKMALMDIKSLEFILSKEESPYDGLPYIGRVDTAILDIPGLEEISATDKIAGILGVNIFRLGTVCFDFKAQMLTLVKGSHPPAHSTDMVTLPLKEKGFCEYYIPIQDLQGQSVDFLLDTGNPITILPQKDVARFGARMTSAVRGLGGMDVGPHVETLALIDALHLGSMTASQVELSIPPKKVSAIEPTLGMNVLARYRVTIDFPAKKVYLQPAADSEKQARLPGLQVAHVQKHGAQVQVDIVMPGSAAYRAGLRDEDRLLAVDGVPVEGVPAIFIGAFVDGFGGIDAHLRVERSGQIHEIVYHRYSLADAIIGAALGVEASMTDDYRMIVDTVTKGSPAQKAGLYKGDSILSINGLAVQTTDNERLHSLLHNPPTNPLVLTVQRNGTDQSEEIKISW